MKKIYLLSVMLFLSFSILSAKGEKNYVVNIMTNRGEITLLLYNKTPLHRDNFVKLCKAGTYDNVLFHRVIKEFMIQAGDPESKRQEPGKLYGEGDLGYTIPAEISSEIFHKKGVLAAAREGDRVNPERKSSACQFYIVVGKRFTDQELDKVEQRIAKATGVKDYKISPEKREVYRTSGGTPHLDMQYTVFGEVLKGMDIAEGISITETDQNDRPLKDICIISTKVSKHSKGWIKRHYKDKTF